MTSESVPLTIIVPSCFIAFCRSRLQGVGIVIVLKKAEKLRAIDANLVPAMMRLQELTNRDISVIFSTGVPFTRFVVPCGLPRPLQVILRPYEEEDLVKIISERLQQHLEAKGGVTVKLDEDFYQHYTRIILGTRLD